MNTKVSYLPLPKGKHVFIHYKGKIREAEYIRTEVCPKSAGSSTYFQSEFVFKMAGIEGEVKRDYSSFKGNAFYSLKDAKNCENPIEVEEQPMEFFNQFTSDFVLDTEEQSAMAWKWNETRPEYTQLKWIPSFVIDDNKVFLINGYTRERIVQSDVCYKTREECMANNEAEIVTF